MIYAITSSLVIIAILYWLELKGRIRRLENENKELRTKKNFLHDRCRSLCKLIRKIQEEERTEKYPIMNKKQRRYAA